MEVDERLLGEGELLFVPSGAHHGGAERRSFLGAGALPPEPGNDENRIALIKKMLLFISLGINENDRHRRTVKMKPHLLGHQAVRIGKILFIKGVVDDAPVLEGMNAPEESTLPFKGEQVKCFGILFQVHTGQ